jgi:hypothetical protein
MSSLEPDIDQLRKQIISEIRNANDWGVYDIGLKLGVISCLISFFYTISIMGEATPVIKLLMGFVPIGVGLGIWAANLAVVIVARVLLGIFSDIWIGVALLYGMALLFGW